MVLCDVLCHGAPFGPRGERSGPTVGAARCAHSRGSVRRPKPSRLLLPSLRANPPPLPQPIPPLPLRPYSCREVVPAPAHGKAASILLFDFVFSFLRFLFVSSLAFLVPRSNRGASNPSSLPPLSPDPSSFYFD